MAMKEYTVTINGVEHTMRLDDQDVKRYKDAGQDVKEATASKSSAPQNKSRA